MSNINTRIRDVVTLLELEDRDMAEYLGVSYGTITKYLSGNESTIIPSKFVEEFLAKIPVRAEWLTTGVGEIFPEGFDPESFVPVKPKHHKLDSSKRGVISDVIDRVVSIRKEKRMSQQAFAEELGFERHNQASMENYRQNPSIPYMIALRKKFNINPIWLQEGIGDPYLDGELMADKDLVDQIKEKDIMIKQLLVMLNQKGN